MTGDDFDLESFLLPEPEVRPVRTRRKSSSAASISSGAVRLAGAPERGRW